MPLPSTFDALWGRDRAAQNAAYADVMAAVAEPVDWADEAWDDVVANLAHADNHNRAIAAQVLCGLAKSDAEGRIFGDLPALLTVTRDERFVTARHALQSLWKVGTVSPRHRAAVVTALAERFRSCGSEKNGTLVRYDVAEGLRRLYDATGDAAVKAEALALIAEEADPKYRAKYARLWRAA